MLKKIVITFLFLFSVFSFSQKNKNTIGFIENKGQILDQNNKENKSVLYLLNTNGLNVQLRKNGFSYDVYEKTTKPASKKQNQKDKFNFSKSENQPEIKQKTKFHRIDIDFINSNSNTKLVSEEKSIDYDNYYNLVHAPNAITNIHKFKKVTYQNIYNKIDVVFFIPEDSTKVVEYNFIVKPGGKISDIQLQFTGAKTELANNKIKMTTRFGDMEEMLPMSWIEEETNKKQVSIQYKKINNNVYGLESSEDLLGKKIIIDPVPYRLWGTLYGGENDDISHSITNDNLNNVYISGHTQSTTNIATSGSYQNNLNNISNIFIAKFNPNGLRLYGTYFYHDTGYYNSAFAKIKVDNQNNLFLLSNELYNTNLATPNAFQVIKNNYNDLFLVKFDEFGIRQWATYYGGNGNEDCNSICFDSSNNIYIAGSTNSTDIFSTPGAHQINNNSALILNNPTDAFIAKFDTNGNRLWSTFYGGTGADGFTNISISNDNYLYASGIQNSSTNISTPGSFQENYVATNITVGGMIVKFDLNGQRIWGTYIADNTINYSGVLKNNYLYLYGHTYNNYSLGTLGTMYPNFQNPIPGSSFSYFSEPMSSYMLKFDVTSQQIVWGTYFIDRIHQLSVNNSDEVYFVGDTGLQNDIATADGFLPTNNGNSAFLIKLNPNCQKIWGTYYKGNGGTAQPKIQIDYDNNIYMYGHTYGNTIGMTTPGAHQTSQNSYTDTFLVKFNDCFSATAASSNTPTCAGSTLNLTASGGTNYTWTGPNGFTSNIQNPSISNVNATHSGQYTCIITVLGGCSIVQKITVQINDTPTPSGNTNQSFCSTANATVSDIIATGTNINWYNSATSTTPLANTTLLSNNTTYYATQTSNNCESVNRLAVTISLINSLNATNYSEFICDNLNNNQETSNLSNYNTNLISSTGNIFKYYLDYNQALLNSNQQINNFANYNLALGTNTFYVRIESPNTCFQIVTLTLELVSKPRIPINDIAPICEGSFITLNGGNNYDSYTWSTGETTQLITITQPGNYSVIVTENHGTTICSSTKNFTVVKSNIATIQEIISSDWTDNNNTISVQLHNNSQGDYEYSLNGIDFQDSNVFSNLEAGEYTVFVKDKNGCGMVSDELYLLMYPKFFTPNGDGFNDFWKIKFSENEPNLTVKIFDRYGKLVKQLATNSMGWDGTYLGKAVPSSDYWFVVTRNNGKEYKGHFSLKR